MQEIDERIFEAVRLLKAIGKIKRLIDVYKVMGIAKQNYYTIRRGEGLHFTVQHIYKFIHHYQVNPGFIFLRDSDLLREPAPHQ